MVLEIITPEASILNTEVSSVTVPGINGSFEMLNDHAPIVSLLDKGIVIIRGEGIKVEKKFADKFEKIGNDYQLNINSGTIEMNNNKIIILAD